MADTHRCQTCGGPLSRYNPNRRCGGCETADRRTLDGNLRLPPALLARADIRHALHHWDWSTVFTAALATTEVSQTDLATATGLSQSQVSRLAAGRSTSYDIRTITRIVDGLGIPRPLAGLAPPATTDPDAGGAADQTDHRPLPGGTDQPGEEGDRVKRRDFMATTGITLASGLLGPPQLPRAPLDADRQALEWFAWHLWQHHTGELHGSQIPAAVRTSLDRHPHVAHTPDGSYHFTDPALTDVLVAHRVFDDITQGSGHLLATAQTSHATDLTISALTASDDYARQGLIAWMRRGPTAVLRVNAAGILAKVGSTELADAVIAAMRADDDARHLYLTAVAHRVLRTPWDQASSLTAAVGGHATAPLIGSEPGHETWATGRLTAELANPRDAAARWCSAVLLATLPSSTHDTTRAALMSAVQHETCRENLRAYAAVLAGANPLAI